MPALRELPALVWAGTSLHLVLLMLGSLTMPLFEVPDERFHADMVVAAMEGNGWPEPGSRRFSTAIEAGGRILRSRPKIPERAIPPRPHPVPADASEPCTGRPRPECEYQPSFDELVDYPIGPGPINRASQHPPLYYVATATTASTIASIVPLPWELSIDQQLWLWRFVSLLMVLPLPALAALAARELGADTVGMGVAALVPLAVPAFYFRSASMINNDALLIVLAGVATWLSLRLAGRGSSRRLTIAIGITLGLALLTKGLALVLPAVPLVAYWIASRRHGHEFRAIAWEIGLLGAVTTISGGWWWVRNVLVHGQLQPLVLDPRTAEPHPFSAAGGWFIKWVVELFRSFWGGWFVGRTGMLITILGLMALASIAFGMLRDHDRRLQGLALLLLPLLLAGVAATSLWRFLTSGLFKAAQGRYAYPALVGIGSASAVGWVWALRRWLPRWHRALPIIVIAGALAMHVLSYVELLQAVWGTPGDDMGTKFEAMLAWSPFGPGLPLIILILAGVSFVGAQVVAIRTAAADT